MVKIMTINNFKHSIWSFIISIIVLIFICIGLIVLAIGNEWIPFGSYIILLVMGYVYFFLSLIDLQWFKVIEDKIVVNNIFGLIKEINYINLKKAFVINETIFSIKMLSITKPYLVLSNYKSLQKSQVNDAYNRKKHKYIIIPFSKSVEVMIKTKYKAATGLDLEIK